jgi:hypothetical protein
MKSHRPRNALLSAFALAGALSAVTGRAALGAEDDQTCAATYEDAQQRESSAHLLQARELLQKCAKARCGRLLQQTCTTKLTRIESDIPSVVPIVTDEGGAPRVNVQVTMDGEPLTAQIDGRAVSVDPGVHEFTFSTSEGVVATRKVLVAQGHRNRPIAVSLRGARRNAPGKALAAADDPGSAGERREAAPQPQGTKLDATVPEPRAQGGSYALTYTLVGVGLLGIASFGVLTQWGRKDNDMLAQCAPTCPSASVQHIRRLYLAADVSLGVGIAALGAAYWAAAHVRSTTEERQSRQAYNLGIQPTRSGGFATLSGSFK